MTVGVEGVEEGPSKNEGGTPPEPPPGGGRVADWAEDEPADAVVEEEEEEETEGSNMTQEMINVFIIHQNLSLFSSLSVLLENRERGRERQILFVSLVSHASQPQYSISMTPPPYR